MAILIGVSGVSSSGKTTLARLLRDIWPRTFVIHEDDFYFEDSQIPVKEVGGRQLQDWDCLEAVDITSLERCLEHIRLEGTPPSNFVSKEDQNSIGESGVDVKLVETWKKEVSELEMRGQIKYDSLAIIDGFLLYSQAMPDVWKRLDLRILLRTSYENAKRRREARSGYVTLEGFWTDPPGYVDDIVWPNYVKEHSFLFEEGNVEGTENRSVCSEMKLAMAPFETQQDINACLDWACQQLRQHLVSR